MSDIALYTSDRLDDDAFLAHFIARTELAAFLLDLLRQDDAEPAEHHLVVGARGMGKTTLLRRIAIGIARDPALAARYAGLTFREEQYNVLTLDGFWRNCGEALAEWYERDGQEDRAAALDAAMATPAWQDDGKPGEAFLAACREAGRRPVLLVDNLNLILDALGEENWVLRRVLQEAGGPILYGAATQFLHQSSDSEAAFYEFFRPHHLEPLDADELISCMRALAEVRGEAGAPVLRILNTEPERLKTLHALTGGNPRVLALIYRLLEGADGGTVMQDLQGLLDEVTPYYKARVEEYQTKLQRAVIDAIALNWNPITARGVADATRTPITSIPAQLIRLKQDGLIEEVELSGASAGYQLAERFFNIWYLMRHGARRMRLRVRWLTEFFRNIYADDELRRMWETARSGGDAHSHYLYREALAATMVSESLETVAASPSRPVNRPDQVESAPFRSDVARRFGAPAGDAAALYDLAYRHLESGKLRKGLAAFDEMLSLPANELTTRLTIQGLYNKGWALGRLGRVEEAIASYANVVARWRGIDDPLLREFAARALGNMGLQLARLDRPDEEIAAFDEVVRRFGDVDEAPLRRQVAMALFNKGGMLARLGRFEEAIAVCDEVVRRYGEVDEAPLRYEVASVLVNKGGALNRLGRPEEAIAVYDEILGRYQDLDEALLREPIAMALVNKGLRLHELGRSEKAIAAYDEVTSRFGEADDAELREQVATAFFNKAVALGRLDRSEEAIVAYDEFVARYGDVDESRIRYEVAGALLNKGTVLSQLERFDKAIAIYDDLLRRYGDCDEARLREPIAKALGNKASDLGKLGRYESGIAACDELLRRFGEVDEPQVRPQVAKALIRKGVALAQLGRTEDAVALFDEVLRRFGDIDEAPLREQVAIAWVNRGIGLGELGRPDEEIAAYDEVVRRFGDVDEAPLREEVVRALVNTAITVGQLGRSEDEIARYDEIVRRYGHWDEAAVREQVARALFNKALALGRLGRPEEAIAAYDEVVRRYEAFEEAPLHEKTSNALLNKGVTLGQLGRREEAIAVYEEVARRYGHRGEAALRAQAAKALISKGNNLRKLGRTDDQIAVYDEVVRRFGAADDPRLREQVATALVSKSAALGKSGRTADAIAICDEIVRRFGDIDEPPVRGQVVKTLVNRGFGLGELGRTDDQIAAYDEVVRRFGDVDEAPVREQVARALVNKADILADKMGAANEAEAAYRHAVRIETSNVIAKANLAWLMATTGRREEAVQIRPELQDVPPAGLAFLDAALELMADNFGAAVERLREALDGDDSDSDWNFVDDILRLLRLAEARGFGEKLIEWFETSGNADRYAPLHAAFVAYVRGDRFLKDFSPEVRRPAKKILEQISAPRRHGAKEKPEAPRPPRKRGR